MTDLAVETLCSNLSLIEQAAPGTVAKAPRAHLLKTIAFLMEHEGKTVRELVAVLELLKPPPKTPRTTTSARPKKPKLPVQMHVVENYTAKLKAAEQALDDFETALATMRADKQVRVDELKAIVSAYSGDTSSIKSKIAGFGVIQRAFDSRWNLRQHKESVASHN
jgi:hypothetical protein